MSARFFQRAENTFLRWGVGALRSLSDVPALASAKRVLLVSDKTLSGLGFTAKVESLLGDRYAFSDIDAQPDGCTAHIDTLAGRMQSEGVDAIVAVGGGSVIDTAKAVAAVHATGKNIQSLAGLTTVKRRSLPVVAVPTTAGTGAETTQFAVVMNQTTKEKIILVDEAIVPVATILDPELTRSLPEHVTSHCGVDAMTHALEASSSKLRNPLGDAYAGRALHMILHGRALERCLEKGDDMMARMDMMMASHLAGRAINASMLGACHAFAHALGAYKGVAHGLANGVFLLPTLRLNQEKVSDVFQGLALHCCAVPTVEGLLARVGEVLHAAKIPLRLGELNIQESDVDALAKIAFADPDHPTNPVRIRSVEECAAFIKAVL